MQGNDCLKQATGDDIRTADNVPRQARFICLGQLLADIKEIYYYKIWQAMMTVYKGVCMYDLSWQTRP